jgi:hypothetical protein
VFRDGKHVVEFEVLSARGRAPARVSMRFTLCHPDSVDRVFLEIATNLMTRQSLSASICEDLPDGTPRDYSQHEIGAFRVWCLWSIDHARRQWQRQFGPERIAVSTAAAWKHFLFDRFQIPCP